MKNVTRIKALALAVLMLCSLVLMCACQDDKPGSTAAPTTLSANANYTVKLLDPSGKPITGAAVKFIQNGAQAGMALVNDQGVASKELPRGDYTLELTFTDVENSFYYDANAALLTATQTELEIMVSYAMDRESYETLNVAFVSKLLYTLEFTPASEGATEGTMTIAGEKDKTLDGTYNYSIAASGVKLTDASGNDVDITIEKDLGGLFALQTSDMPYGQRLFKDGKEISDSDFVGTFYVQTSDCTAYNVKSGSTYVTLDEAGRNYFLFTPTRAGIYKFSVIGEDLTIGYYGTPFYMYEESIYELVDGAFNIVVSSDMIGTGDTGTSQYVIGIDTETAGTTCYLNVEWIGEVPLDETNSPWVDYTPTIHPEKYTLPEGLTLKEFDLSADSYELVFNEADGYYHLNSEDGPVVLVRLLSDNTYMGAAFGNILLGANVGKYYYDENGKFEWKELYNACLLEYLGEIKQNGISKEFTGGMCDDVNGVYPLTKDLEYIIKSYCGYVGYWDNANPNYLFADIANLNTDLAWLFVCCYAE